MKTKTKIKVLGYEYTVEIKPRTGSAGRSSLDWSLMEIDSDLSPQQMDSALIHEIIEQINKILDLGLSHWQICGLEAGIWSFLEAAGVDLGIIFRKNDV